MSRILLLLGFLAFSGPAAAQPSHKELAEHFAPVIYQEAASQVLDDIAAFDFDGDWNGANNWRNAYLFDLKAYVYYSVIESAGHYFITYAFFHPRDYTGQPMEGYAPKMEHENDMEGCTLLVEKDGSQWGFPIVLETLAHDHFYIYTNSSSRHVGARNARPDGSIVFATEDADGTGQAPAVFIEAEGHGVRGAGPHVLDEGFEHPGLIYRRAGRGPEVPSTSRDQDVSYELISIEESLWPRRHDVAETGTYCCGADYELADGTVARWGDSFNGPIGGCAARPPWGWDQADDGPIGKGDWFRDPVRTFGYQLRIDALESRYLHNPYLEEAEPVSGIPQCEGPATSSRTVKESILGTLLGIGTEILSGGLNREKIKGKASTLFLSGTALLEWPQSTIVDQWVGSGLESARESEEASDEDGTGPGTAGDAPVRINRRFRISSQPFRAPARYFDQLAIRYRCSGPEVPLTVSWITETMLEFDTEHAAPLTLECNGEWRSLSADLTSSSSWDSDLSLLRLQLESGAGGSGTPAGETDQFAEGGGQIEVRYIVLDRRAFADTFVE